MPLLRTKRIDAVPEADGIMLLAASWFKVPSMRMNESFDRLVSVTRRSRRGVDCENRECVAGILGRVAKVLLALLCVGRCDRRRH